MKKNVFYITLMVILSIGSGCYNDTEEELYGTAACNLESLTYSLDVVPILSKNCYTCHSQSNAPGRGAGIVLESYDKLMVAVKNGLLLESITHGPNASPMPKNGLKLSECKINTIRKWIENGALNN